MPPKNGTVVAFLVPMHVIHINLTHIAALIFSAAVLISQPEFAMIVIFVAGFNLAFALASVLSLGHCYLNGKLPQISHSLSALIGTHCGGIVCYMIIISYALQYSNPA